MKITSKNLAKALVRSLENGTDVSTLSKNFAVYLKLNHLESLIPNVLENLEMETAKLSRFNSAEISVSHELKEKTISQIEEFINKDPRDKTKVALDENLIGGFKAIYRGRVFDGSIKNYLKELREVLAK